jgi:hypothetical protein
MKGKPFFTLILLIYILKSCTCDNPEVPFSFNQSNIQLLNNSGEWAALATTDSLHAEAIAFRLTMADSTYYPLHVRRYTPPRFLFFPEAQALSCTEKFTPTHSITEITITSLLPFNELISGQTDVTDKFYALLSSGLYSEHLYYSIEQTIQNFNNIKYFEDYTQEELNFFLSSTIIQDQAQFQINIRFSDGTLLSETTPIIHIIH